MKEYDNLEAVEADKPEPDYEVGYGKPPKSSQFKKGQSGNPKRGKNKTKSFLKHFEEEMAKSTTAVQDGEVVRMSRMEAAAVNLSIKAMKGDPVGLKLLLETSKSELRDQRLEAEVEHLRTQLKKARIEYEALKEENKGGYLAIPERPMNDLEYEMFDTPPEEMLERIKQRPEELLDMLHKKYERFNKKTED